MRSRALRLAALAPVAIPLLLAPACHRAVPSICRQTCECKPCTDADLEKCIEDMDAIVEANTKCEAELDAYLACYDETLSCQNGAGVGTDRCSVQEQVLSTCSGKGNPFQNVCEQAAIKVSKCAGTEPQPGGVDCSESTKCTSECVLDASCDVIVGAEFSPEFQGCIGACLGEGGAGGGF